jgi:hypothetical protein
LTDGSASPEQLLANVNGRDQLNFMARNEKMYSHRILLVFVCFSIVIAGGPVATAQNEAVPELAEIDLQVRQWIEKLDAPRFSERARASLELQRLGSAAIEPLEKVVRNGDSEAAGRALGILKRNFLSDNPKLSDPAREVLSRIANTEDHPQAPFAQRILTPPESEAQPSARPRALRVPAPVPIKMNIQVQIKSVNGKKDIQIKQNGQQFRFRDQADGIEVERPDGKGGIKKDKYKDKDELKTKDPEAHQIYERYSGKGNRIQIQIGQPFQKQIPRFQIQPRIEIRPRRTLPDLRRPDGEAPRAVPPQAVPPQPAPRPVPKPKPKLSDTIEV